LSAFLPQNGKNRVGLRCRIEAGRGRCADNPDTILIRVAYHLKVAGAGRVQWEMRILGINECYLRGIAVFVDGVSAFVLHFSMNLDGKPISVVAGFEASGITRPSRFSVDFRDRA
jgi:hypothetical protein